MKESAQLRESLRRGAVVEAELALQLQEMRARERTAEDGAAIDPRDDGDCIRQVLKQCHDREEVLEGELEACSGRVRDLVFEIEDLAAALAAAQESSNRLLLRTAAAENTEKTVLEENIRLLASQSAAASAGKGTAPTKLK